jgi:hypothetical protein
MFYSRKGTGGQLASRPQGKDGQGITDLRISGLKGRELGCGVIRGSELPMTEKSEGAISTSQTIQIQKSDNPEICDPLARATVRATKKPQAASKGRTCGF